MIEAASGKEVEAVMKEASLRERLRGVEWKAAVIVEE